MQDKVYIYRWDRCGRKGQRCRVTARGTMNSCRVVRAPGEIVLLQRVMARWGFDDREAARLIGYEDAGWMRKLYTGRSTLRTRDEKDRVRAILRIATDLLSLYREEGEIRAWLREKKKLLGGQSAYDLMMEGSMENLLRVKQFIEVLSGR